MYEEVLMIPHTLKHRRNTGTKQNRLKEEDGEIAYNTIVARLFHKDSADYFQSNVT